MMKSLKTLVLSIAAMLVMAAMPVYADGTMVGLRSEDGKLLMDVPTTLLGREVLISSCISRTSHPNYLSVGNRPHSTHARFEFAGDAVWLRRVNTEVVGDASDSLSIESIRDSYMDPVLAKLPLVSSSSDGQTLTVDATDLFTTDKTFSPFPWHFSRVKVSAEKDLCRLVGFKTFEDNFTVRSLLSYRYTPKDGNSPSGICSAEVTHSVLLLPEDKMRPRLADSRVGPFTEKKKMLDFAQSDFYRDIAFAQRWRVEPSDWKAWSGGEAVTPKKQIVYYIDNAFPETWKAPLKKGILKWNEAFLRFGLKDVIAVRDYPTDDPDFDEDNLKYNCIRYVSTDRGAAQGPSWADPTTGELLNATVYVWASLPQIMNRFCFVQTAHANPGIRSGRMSDEELSLAIQNIITHEIGHTLGMAHNMGGSSAYAVDSLLNADFVRRNGLTASVMDYIYYNYIVPPGETDVPLISTNLGAYDELCLEYIYRPTDLGLSVAEDQKIAETWIDAHAGDPRYRYGIQQWGTRYDPTTLTDDIGDDALRAGEMSITNMKYILDHLEEWLAGGDRVTQRRDMYRELQRHYVSVMKAVLYNVGGIRLSFAKEGTDAKVYECIPAARQKQALRWYAKELRGSSWIDRRSLTDKFEIALDASVDLQARLAKELLEIADKVTLCAHLSKDPYTLREYVNDLYQIFFEAPYRSVSLTQADKVIQRTLLNGMLERGIGESFKGEFSTNANDGSSDEAQTSFALRADGGYLDDIDVSQLSEAKAIYFNTLTRIHSIAKMKYVSAPAADKDHWTLIFYTLDAAIKLR